MASLTILREPLGWLAAVGRRWERLETSSCRRTRAGVLMVVAVLMAGFLAAPAVAQEGSVGVVVKLTGTASAIRPDGNVTLQLGDLIFVGDRLQTDRDGTLGVTLKDNSLLSLGPNSAFELTSFVLDPVAGDFAMGGRIINGSMAVTTGEIGKIAPENVEFETPFGVVGIRGTRFAVTVN